MHKILANRTQYSFEEGHRCTAEAGSDNGPGIDPEELPHMFERFYRARHGRRQHSGGTGMGLAICKAFIEAHAGTIWVESSVQGTTISFSLPLTALIEARNGASASTAAREWRDV